MACEKRIPEAIATLVAVFHEYASKDCKEKACGKDACLDQFKLSKRELKELLQKELDMDEAKDPGKVEEVMKELDADGDGQLDFYEFLGFVAQMACACNLFLELFSSGEIDIDE